MPTKPKESVTKTHPHLVDELDKEKNGNIDLSAFTKGSNVKLWWKCLFATNHPSWKAMVNSRTSGNNCPYCFGRFPIVGETDLASQPELSHLLREWDYVKNTLTPQEVTSMSAKRMHWTGEQCGHSWEQSIYARALGRGCPYCAGVRVLVGFNDFSTTHPHLAKLWHPDNTLSPDQVTAGSGKRAKLLFPCSHIWENSIVEFTRKSSHCPYCAGSLFLSGFNDLATTHPHLAAEWHPTKNTFSPTEVMAGSGKKAWWLGNCGHEWEAQINSRKRGNGCRQCSFNGSSKIERALLQSLLPTIADANTGKIALPGFNRPVQADIMGTYNGHKIVIEYDGYNWHNSQQDTDLDIRKTTELLRQGHLVVRVRELIYARTLPHLLMTDDNLFQITMNYTVDHRDLARVVDEIKMWLLRK
jgi:hypothetical protein